LAAIWADVLDLPQIGIEDSFFDLGGDSIRAVRLVGALREAGHDVSIRDVFQQRTIAALATALPGTGTGESLITAVQPFALIGEEDRNALPADVVDAYPLSQIQTGMLVELMSTENEHVYRNINSSRIPDTRPFDAEAFRRAADIVVARHDILRTSMHLEGYSQPLQLVHAEVEIPVAIHDLRGLSQAEIDEQARAYVEQENRTGFVLTSAPLMRFAAHVESDQAWRLTVSHLHVITDGWTINSLLMEFLGTYQALRDGREPAAYEVPAVRYADYVAAEQDALSDPATQEFWQQVVDAHGPLALPAAWGGEPGESVRARVPFADLEDGLRELAAEAKTSLKSVMLAAHLKVMSSLTADEAFHTGVVYHGRLEAPGADRVFGMHLNTLPFPTSRGARTWRELVERTYATETAIWSHRRYPLPAVQRAAGNSNLINVMFEFQDFHQVDTAAVDVEASLNQGTTEFALNAIASGGTVQLGGSSEFFTQESLERLGAMYRSVLEAMAADADGDARAAHLPADELSLLLDTWNATVEEPVEECVHELFAAQAARTPDAVALTSGELSLTYAELDERANRIAHHLIALGAGPERIVGLSLERGPDLIPALLGILKSGAAYLPLDPANPADRLAYMLADAKAELLVTHSALDELEFTGTRVLIDTHQDEIAAHPATAPVTGVRPDNLIYVIYTSGSTGLPKGVSLTHTNVVRLFTAAREQVGFTEGDVWALFHSYAFDVSVFEMWGALLHGGRLVVVPSAIARSPQEMAELLVREQVGVLCQTPSAFRSLAATVIDDAVQSLALRMVVFAGERLDVPDLAAWTERFGWNGPVLVNMYGPTEITVYATFHRVTAAELSGPRRSVIGRHLADLTIHLLDRAGRPVPVGVPGELHVGGPGVARGYLDRPELTADRFLPNPYGPAGSRLYATGDLARFLPDGSIDYLGRIDNQIKLRGYRIELGEIESALGGLDRIREAVVVVREETLVAYVVTDGGELDVTAVRRELAVTLPEYMVPAAFVTLDAIPLNSSGKTDRRALPAPDLEAFTASRYTAPRTPLEERIAAIWAEVLGLAQAGVEDSFFDLGGDSIRAVRLVGAMRATGYDVSVRDVFEQRTIAAMAAALPGVGTGESLITAVEPFALIGEDDRTALPADVVDAYPLSQAQTGILVEVMSSADRAVYHNIDSFRLPDPQPFDAEAFRRAVDTVVARHDVLRTSMHLDGYSQPLQLVHAVTEAPVAVFDLRGLTEAEVAERALAFAEEERTRGFELAAAPLLRIAAHVESDQAWRLTISHNHAITDGWTLNSLLMELLGAYQDLRDGREPVAHEAPAVRYADFIAAEQDALSDPATQSFWQQVVDAHGPLALPASWGGEPGERVGVRVPFADLEDGLRKLAAEAKTSLKTVMLAAHLKVMSSLTADEAFHTGVVYHGRLEAPGSDRVLGMHLNSLPFPTTRGARTWRELIERTYATETAIWSHRRYPLPAVQRAAGSSGGLINVLFDHHDFHQVDTDSVDVEATMAGGSNEFALMAIPQGGHFNLSSSTEFFTQESLERLGAMYRLVLEAMAADADGDARATHLPADELSLLLGTWNETAEEPVEECVHELFAAQAARTPDAVALTSGELNLTYAELDERANRIAHHLISLGAGPERIVGLSLERGPDLIPALLGILKSGAAYLPLDPANPADRLAYMLADAKAELLVTHSALAELEFTGTRVLVDTHQDEIAAHPATAPVTGVRPDNQIYVIYTSGSTGLPKGVSLTHTNVARLFTATRENYHFGPADVWPLFHSYAFDVSVWEMWGALLHGGRLVVVPRHTSRSPHDMLDLLVAERATILCQTPSAFRTLTQLAGDGDPRIERLALRAVVFAGERLEMAELRPWAERVGTHDTALVNMYGITETTVHSTYHRITEQDVARSAHSPVGSPMDDTAIHVLDARGHLVPVGVPGEIHVSGPAVARGYLNRPELTAERFVPNPYGPAGSRLYRSGDLALRLADGTLESLGRIDKQVKLRGYRIELGEIETALTELPEIRQSVVIVRENEAGEKSLVAYVVPAADAVPDTIRLRAHLGASLPEYMVPAAFVTLDAIPLTTNGKADTRALPAPDLEAFTASRYTAPRTPLEERLAAIWAEVLGLAQVGVEDSFFDLGGDSIRAVRLVGAMRAAGYDVSIPDVFEQRTIAAMAAALPGAGTGESLITAVQPFALIGEEDRKALPADVVDAYPLSQIQTGMLVEMLAAQGGSTYRNINSFLIPDELSFSLDVLRRAVDTVVARHDILRTSMHLGGYSQPLQLVHATAEVPITAHDLRGLTEAKVAERTSAYVEQERATDFELTAAPLLRIAAHVESDEAWRLTFSHIHAVTEGWSYHTLVMEIVTLYRSLRNGDEPAAYETPAVRYADFIAAEQDALSDPATQSFWQQVVDEHAPMVLPESWGEGERGERERHGVPVPFLDIKDGLTRLAAEAKTSIKSVLLAAHLKVMSSLTADEAFHTGVVYHGRMEAPGADRVLGMHLNTLPFPASRGAKTWRELVEQTYATETAIWSHRRYPLPAVQRAAGSSGDLVSILFEYLDFHVVDGGPIDAEGSMGDGANEFALNVLARPDRVNLSAPVAVVGRERLALLGERYRLVLEAMAADPDGDATAAYLPEAERAQLAAWAAGDSVQWPTGTTLDLFEAQAAATPDATAVIVDGLHLTYREVDDRANRIAHHLAAVGAGPDVLIGVCLERGANLVPTLLGVWKAGAAYLPLDPAWPTERLAHVLADTATPAIVTSTALADTVGAQYDGTLVVIEREQATIDRRPATAPQRTLDGQNLAYAIYTSGSTGRP
ncbi:amino acid adenylation domain-containing protein, partial [Kitasatospora sp. NPDC050463]|uniref:amino acid adenylation domain-containing protein n=1 Tax=Kitasatospora sp. NPDC050463 TaxID=3155786 RepID=UPI0033D5CCDF